MDPSSTKPEGPLPHHHLIVAYKGSNYSGWQFNDGQSTVQGTLIDAAKRLYQTDDIDMQASSRTDTGVHALGQSVSFFPPAQPDIDVGNVKKALNGFLPADIRIVSATTPGSDFHARHSAIGKAYSYVIHRSADASPFVGQLALQERQALSIAAMDAAAAHLIGRHNFTTFSAKAKDKDDDDDVHATKELHRFYFKEYGDFHVISVIGSGFMYRMVRRLAGFLIEVGKGRLEPDSASAILDARERNAPFSTAEPQGLYLERVFYDEDAMATYEPSQLPFLAL